MPRIHALVGQGVAIDVSNKMVSSRAFIEASNPKSVQFYCSFLLQFADPDASLGLGWQLFLLGACANLPFPPICPAACSPIRCMPVRHCGAEHCV